MGVSLWEHKLLNPSFHPSISWTWTANDISLKHEFRKKENDEGYISACCRQEVIEKNTTFPQKP